MAAGTLTSPLMAKTKPPKEMPQEDDPETGRVEFQAPPKWIKQLDAAAESLGVSRSAYIRMACNRQMQADTRIKDN